MNAVIRLCWTGCVAGAALAAGSVAPVDAQPPGIGGVGDRLIVIGKTHAEMCFERARVGDVSRHALGTCDYALSIDVMGPGRAGTFVNRGIVREGRGDSEGALDDYTSALALDPEIAEAYINIGRVRSAMGDWPAAEDALGRAIALLDDPALPPDPLRMRALHFDRASAREEMGDLAGAYAGYEAAAAADPTWDAPRLELERFRIEPGAAAGDGA